MHSVKWYLPFQDETHYPFFLKFGSPMVQHCCCHRCPSHLSSFRSTSDFLDRKEGEGKDIFRTLCGTLKVYINISSFSITKMNNIDNRVSDYLSIFMSLFLNKNTQKNNNNNHQSMLKVLRYRLNETSKHLRLQTSESLSIFFLI